MSDDDNRGIKVKMFEEKTEDTFKKEERLDFDSMAQNHMEEARQFHERYLIKGNRNDLNSAVDSLL